MFKHSWLNTLHCKRLAPDLVMSPVHDGCHRPRRVEVTRWQHPIGDVTQVGGEVRDSRATSGEYRHVLARSDQRQGDRTTTGIWERGGAGGTRRLG